MEKPKIISGNQFSDHRGTITFNNDFVASKIKRIYFIENVDVDFIRAWQGHKIEQRWFSAVCGEFEIKLVKVDNWQTPNKEAEILEFELSSTQLDILHIPPGYISSIQARECGAKLMVMADYCFGEIVDEYRFPVNYFQK